MIDKKDIDTIELVDVRVNREPNGIFTFGLKYIITYKNGRIEEIELPRVTSPFYEHNLVINHETCQAKHIETNSQCALKLVFDEENGIEYSIAHKVIKEADPVEMTMDEIEAALGKRIKIVNKGDKK